MSLSHQYIQIHTSRRQTNNSLDNKHVTYMSTVLPVRVQHYLYEYSVYLYCVQVWVKCYLYEYSVTYISTMLPVWVQCYLYEYSVTCISTVLPVLVQCYLHEYSVTCMSTVLPVWVKGFICSVNADVNCAVSLLYRLYTSRTINVNMPFKHTSNCRQYGCPEWLQRISKH